MLVLFAISSVLAVIAMFGACAYAAAVGYGVGRNAPARSVRWHLLGALMCFAAASAAWGMAATLAPPVILN